MKMAAAMHRSCGGGGSDWRLRRWLRHKILFVLVWMYISGHPTHGHFDNPSSSGSRAVWMAMDSAAAAATFMRGPKPYSTLSGKVWVTNHKVQGITLQVDNVCYMHVTSDFSHVADFFHYMCPQRM